MSCHVFSVFFLLLFVCCLLCGQGCVASSAQIKSEAAESSVEFFTPEEVKNALNPGGKEVEKITVKHIESTFLSAANDVMVAVAEITYYEEEDTLNEIIFTKKFETKGENWSEKAVQNKEGSDEWKTKVLKQRTKNKNDDAAIKSFAVTATNDKIYYVTVSNTTFGSGESTGPSTSSTSCSFAKWYVRLVEGKVVNGAGEAEKTINWTTLSFPVSCNESGLKGKLETQPAKILPPDGFAFLSGDEKNIYFFMRGKPDTEGSDNKNFIAVLQLKVDDEKKADLVHFESVGDRNPSFFQWEKEIFMASTDNSNGGNKTLMVFNTSERKFTETSSPISFLRGFLKGKKIFATTTIKNKTVLLFTQQKTEHLKKNVYLWMTDGTRVANVGAVLTDIESLLFGSVVYAENELVALFYRSEEDDEGNPVVKVLFKRLAEQLKNITDTLDAWETNAETVLALCKDSEMPDSNCTTLLSTDGLVGFLHNVTNEETTVWKDMYSYSNAAVRNAHKVSNGLKFNGTDAGARWPVKKPKEDQPYDFTDLGFTLAATVTVGSITSGANNSILGVCIINQTKNVGLWCTADGNWGVGSGTNKTKVQSSTVACESDTTYYLSVILNKSKVFIYVDGEHVTSLEDKIIEKKDGITHFYFGADSDTQPPANSNVTITNVLLYNRPFTDEEIEKLKTIKEIVETNSSSTSNTSPTENDKNEATQSSPPPTTEDSAVRVGVVGVLCFMLFGVFTLLGRYVY